VHSCFAIGDAANCTAIVDGYRIIRLRG